MEVTDEEFGGTRVILQPGDSLNSVPPSHRRLVTAEIKAWWADPVRAIRGVADRAGTPNMGRWFGRMADAGSWRLELHLASYGAMRAGYWLSCPGIRGAEVAPPPAKPAVNHLPPACRTTIAWWGTSIGWGSGRPAGSMPWRGTHR